MFLVLIAVTTLVFAVTPLDIIAARLFYSPLPQDHWPLAVRLPWSVLYRLAPWITASLVIGAFAGLAVALLRGRPMWRRYAVFVLLSVALGPGLMVNAVFKDHWDRPRPRDIVQFAGLSHYTPAPLRGEGGGSFPCGHCSVGFLYALGFWIWRRRRPVWPRASLATGLATGTLLGIGRMAAGGHFLSDVVWSALLVLGLAHVLYYYVLRIPQHEAAAAASYIAAADEVPPRRLHWSAILAVLCGLVVLGALFVAPHGSGLSQTLELSSLPRAPRELLVTARVANIEVILGDGPAIANPPRILVTGRLHGFGLPTSRLASGFRFDPSRALLEYRIEQRGWFTDLSGNVIVRLAPRGLKRITVQVGRGNIQVTDLTCSGVVRGGALQLVLQTATGHVQELSRPRCARAFREERRNDG